jgi:hypothetical protein
MEKIIGKLKSTLQNLNQTIEANKAELAKLEEDFANVKLNPYGITSVDFSKRQELSQDTLKMEGTQMGIQLAIDLLENNDGSNE